MRHFESVNSQAQCSSRLDSSNTRIVQISLYREKAKGNFCRWKNVIWHVCSHIVNWQDLCIEEWILEFSLKFCSYFQLLLRDILTGLDEETLYPSRKKNFLNTQKNQHEKFRHPKKFVPKVHCPLLFCYELPPFSLFCPPIHIHCGKMFTL